MGSARLSEPDRSWLHHLLRMIDDDLVELGAVRALVAARVGTGAERSETLTVLRALFEADWLRMTTFHRGLGYVLWSEAPAEALVRIDRAWDGPESAFVKMTPTGANALRAMDGPPDALLRFYASRANEPPTPLGAEVAHEVQAVVSVALVPAGLVAPP